MEEDTMGEALRLLRIFNGYKSEELAKKLELSQKITHSPHNVNKGQQVNYCTKYSSYLYH